MEAVMNLVVAKCAAGIALNPKEHRKESAVFSTTKEPQ